MAKLSPKEPSTIEKISQIDNEDKHKVMDGRLPTSDLNDIVAVDDQNLLKPSKTKEILSTSSHGLNKYIYALGFSPFDHVLGFTPVDLFKKKRFFDPNHLDWKHVNESPFDYTFRRLLKNNMPRRQNRNYPKRQVCIRLNLISIIPVIVLFVQFSVIKVFFFEMFFFSASHTYVSSHYEKTFSRVEKNGSYNLRDTR